MDARETTETETEKLSTYLSIYLPIYLSIYLYLRNSFVHLRFKAAGGKNDEEVSIDHFIDALAAPNPMKNATCNREA